MTGVNYATTTAGDDDGSYNAALVRCACTHRAVRATRAVWRRVGSVRAPPATGVVWGNPMRALCAGRLKLQCARARGD